jgi:hypothetical protein
MEYAAMLRGWNVCGGKEEILEGAIADGPHRLKTERMDLNRPYVYPAGVRAERGPRGKRINRRAQERRTSVLYEGVSVLRNGSHAGGSETTLCKEHKQDCFTVDDNHFGNQK